MEVAGEIILLVWDNEVISLTETRFSFSFLFQQAQ